mmetsp:Transcript_724/g.1757  ORF Transcript_724/g.1757 Transcript_724/m.1757 type:complete len:237 (+) Transcript_724:303-1013(+)
MGCHVVDLRRRHGRGRECSIIFMVSILSVQSRKSGSQGCRGNGGNSAGARLDRFRACLLYLHGPRQCDLRRNLQSRIVAMVLSTHLLARGLFILSVGIQYGTSIGLWFVALLWNPQWMDWSFPHHNLRSFIGISRRLCRRRLIFTHSGAHDCRLLYFCHCCQAEEETFKGLMRVRGGRQTVQRLCALFTYTTHVKWRRHQSKKEQISATKCQLYSQAQLFSSTPDIVAANLGSGIE